MRFHLFCCFNYMVRCYREEVTTQQPPWKELQDLQDFADALSHVTCGIHAKTVAEAVRKLLHLRAPTHESYWSQYFQAALDGVPENFDGLFDEAPDDKTRLHSVEITQALQAYRSEVLQLCLAPLADAVAKSDFQTAAKLQELQNSLRVEDDPEPDAPIPALIAHAERVSHGILEEFLAQVSECLS